MTQTPGGAVEGARARRVFLSHTSELRELPKPRSFIAAAANAVTRAGDVVVDMAFFTAADQPSAELCRRRVWDSDVYVLVAGFRYGSPVRNQPGLSYTELELQTATEVGKPRLVFLIDEDADGPARMFRDLTYGARQEAFRTQLGESGMVHASVTSPENLELLLHQALVELPRAATADVPVGRVWNIPNRVATFTGRVDLLHELDAVLIAGGRVVVQALTGMGGVGKTSTAIEYAHRHADQFDIAWWVRAEDPALIPDRLAELAHALRLADSADPTTLTLDRLRAALHRLERWLVVFDNAEDPRALAPLLPAGPGQVVITSRNQHWRGTATSVGLGEFTRTESITLLRTLAPHLSDTDADRIAAAVGDLPLAIDQAGSLLASEALDVDTYVRLLADRAQDVFDYDPGGAYPVSLAASWAVAFDQLDTEYPAALSLLTLLAWLAPEPVPLTLLTDNPHALPCDLTDLADDPLQLSRCTTLLTRRGILTLTSAGLLLHRVPAALLRARTQHTQRGWPAIVLNLMVTALPHDKSEDVGAWPIWQQLLPHALTVTDPGRHPDPGEDVATRLTVLLDGIGRYRRSRGEPMGTEYKRARDVDSQLLAHYRRVLGEDHPNTLWWAIALASDLRWLGEHQQAHDLDADTLARRRRVLGDDHPDTLWSAHNLARDLRQLGEHQQAYDLNADTLARRRRVLGDDHPETLWSAHNLADNLHALGEYQQAYDLDADILAGRRRVLGEDHPNTFWSADRLACDLRELGQHQQAHDLDADTLERRRRILGEDHPDTLDSAHNLALDLTEMGQHGPARALLEDTLTRRRRVLGEDHPDTRLSAENLAEVLRALGEAPQ